MTHLHPWSDGYVTVVADQILWNYQTIWHRLTEIDPAVSYEEIEGLLRSIRSSGYSIGEDTPATLPAGTSVAQEIEQLYQAITRFRQVGSELFTRAGEIPDHIFCTCNFPREYRGIPEQVAANEIEILHLGDTPPDAPDWRRWTNPARFSRLLYLVLFNCALEWQPRKIDLAALPSLRALDLRENGLTAVPETVLGCSNLEYLDLSDNHLVKLPDLDSLQELRYLGLARMHISPEVIDRVQCILPGCEIVGG